MLNLLKPETRRVFTVYDPGRDQWLINRAQAAARRHNLELIAYPASDLKASARHLLKFLRTADPRQDSIWLPLDNRLVDKRHVLPFVIEKSWARRLTVFSSNLAHIRLGVLFALYPNNRELGRQLGELAAERAQQPALPPVVVPLNAVNKAFNPRVADHLNLRIDKSVRQQFQLILQE